VILYILLNIAYSLKLKNVVILDVFCISIGFMLRILVGTLGVGIPPSKWLLLCGMMLTLFLGFAKRRAEIIATPSEVGQRKVLKNYGSIVLDEMIVISAAGVIVTYSLYTMSPETFKIQGTESLIYTVPFLIYGLFRYIYLLHHWKHGQDPARELLKDPHILGSILCWTAATLYLCYYHAR
jgi:4-hydroxybenzoate polyprenyltransferase